MAVENFTDYILNLFSQYSFECCHAIQSSYSGPGDQVNEKLEVHLKYIVYLR